MSISQRAVERIAKPSRTDTVDTGRRPATPEQRQRAFHRVRIGALTKIFGERYGGGKLYVFPDDDAGREDLRILLDHYSISNPLALLRVIKARAPWLTHTERDSLMEQASRFPRIWKSDALAQALSLTEAKRVALGGVPTIGATDVTPEQRAKQRKERNRLQKEQKRRLAGAKPRAEYEANSLSHAKPWEAEGICRKTWERRRNAAVASVSAVKLVNYEGRTCDTEQAEAPRPRQRDGRLLSNIKSHPRRAIRPGQLRKTQKSRVISESIGAGPAPSSASIGGKI
jgi:hypothetical protein